MYLSSSLLRSFIDRYRNVLINKKITDISLVNSRLFIFEIKNLDKKLIIDLDNVHPYISLLPSNFNELSLPNTFLAKLKQKGHPNIKNIELVNNDKIIKITTSSIDAYYHQLTFYLYIELFNGHANMILTDKDNMVISSFYETSLLAPRIIKSHHLYTLPNKNEDKKDVVYDLNEYIEYSKMRFIEGLNKRKKELYGEIIKKENKRLKYLKKKLDNLKIDKEKAYKALKYKDIGNELLMNINNIKKGDTSFNSYTLDPLKSPSENINNYFNKYKKATRSLKIIDDFINKCQDEIEEVSYNLESYNLSKEDEMRLLISEKRKKKDIYKAYYPYFIKYQGTTYYYGKNALNNDYLTFKMFKRNSNVTFLHLKDKSSSHLIINKNNPNDQELEIAANLLLLINKLESAEIMYTTRNNITRSDALGKVNFLVYKSININKINPKYKELLKYEKRIHD